MTPKSFAAVASTLSFRLVYPIAYTIYTWIFTRYFKCTLLKIELVIFFTQSCSSGFSHLSKWYHHLSSCLDQKSWGSSFTFLFLSCTKSSTVDSPVSSIFKANYKSDHLAPPSPEPPESKPILLLFSPVLLRYN